VEGWRLAKTIEFGGSDDEKTLRSSRWNSSRDGEVGMLVKLVLEGREQVRELQRLHLVLPSLVGLVWAEWKQMKYQYFEYMYFLTKAIEVLGF